MLYDRPHGTLLITLLLGYEKQISICTGCRLYNNEYYDITMSKLKYIHCYSINDCCFCHNCSCKATRPGTMWANGMNLLIA